MDQVEMQRVLGRPTASPAECAKILGFSERTFRRAIRDQIVPTISMSTLPTAKKMVPTQWLAEQLRLPTRATERAA